MVDFRFKRRARLTGLAGSMVALAAGTAFTFGSPAHAAGPSFGMTIDSGKATINVSAGSRALGYCAIVLDSRLVGGDGPIGGGYFYLGANRTREFSVDVGQGSHEARIACNRYKATAQATWQPDPIPNPLTPAPPPPEPTENPTPPEPTASPASPKPTKPTPTKSPSATPRPIVSDKPTPTPTPEPEPSPEPTTDGGATVAPVRGPAPTIDASDIPDSLLLGMTANGVSRPNLWGLGGILSFVAAAVIIVIGRMRRR